MSNGRTWTTADDATVRRMAGSGATDREIADHMGRDAKLIGKKRRDLNVTRGVSRSLAAMVARVGVRRSKRRKGKADDDDRQGDSGR